MIWGSFIIIRLCCSYSEDKVIILRLCFPFETNSFCHSVSLPGILCSYEFIYFSL